MSNNTCHNCHGSGSLVCNKCYGSGQIDCFKCEGSGHIDWYGSMSMPGAGIPGGPRVFKGGPRAPSNFAAGGSKPCYKCDTTGKLGCRKCDQSGHVRCLRCDGTGTYQRQR